MTDSKTCRWGIMSTAGIAARNWEAIRNSGNGNLVAVASRDINRAQQFIDTCQTQVPFPEKPRAIGGYDELLAADDIDAVYIPLPTGLRKECTPSNLGPMVRWTPDGRKANSLAPAKALRSGDGAQQTETRNRKENVEEMSD